MDWFNLLSFSFFFPLNFWTRTQLLILNGRLGIYQTWLRIRVRQNTRKFVLETRHFRFFDTFSGLFSALLSTNCGFALRSFCVFFFWACFFYLLLLRLADFFERKINKLNMRIQHSTTGKDCQCHWWARIHRGGWFFNLYWFVAKF